MELALATNSVLDRYIAVHDQIFRSSLRKFFSPIDFDGAHARLVQIESQLQDLNQTVSTLGPPTGFAKTLLDYLVGLQAVASSLTAICALLRSEAKKLGSYPAGQYKADVDEYKRLVERYQALGKNLNEAFRQT